MRPVGLKYLKNTLIAVFLHIIFVAKIFFLINLTCGMIFNLGLPFPHFCLLRTFLWRQEPNSRQNAIIIHSKYRVSYTNG
jgi:hypothetical protein